MNNTGNIIGTDSDGSNDPGERNLISGNDYLGIFLSGPSTVSGNFVGTDANGALDNGNRLVGIVCNIGVQTIGTNGNDTNDAAEGNLISGNDTHGIRFQSSGCDSSVIAGNYI